MSCDLSDEIGHIADDVGSEGYVHQHEEDVVDHLPLIDRIQIAISYYGERCDRPVDTHHIVRPQRLLSEVGKNCTQPCLCLLALGMSCSEHVVEACCIVAHEQRHLHKYKS